MTNLTKHLCPHGVDHRTAHCNVCADPAFHAARGGEAASAAMNARTMTIGGQAPLASNQRNPRAATYHGADQDETTSDYGLLCESCDSEEPLKAAVCLGCWNKLAKEVIDLRKLRDSSQETTLLPGEDIAEALERRGDALSVRAARHIRIKWNTEEGLRGQLRRANDQLNAMPSTLPTTGE